MYLKKKAQENSQSPSASHQTDSFATRQRDESTPLAQAATVISFLFTKHFDADFPGDPIVLVGPICCMPKKKKGAAAAEVTAVDDEYDPDALLKVTTPSSHSASNFYPLLHQTNYATAFYCSRCKHHPFFSGSRGSG
jgi:hypothetical protein